MEAVYKIRLLDGSSIPTMIDVNPDFIENEYTCSSDEHYFQYEYSSLELAQEDIKYVLENYTHAHNGYIILEVYI